VVVRGDMAYLNYEAFWGNLASADAKLQYRERLGFGGRIAMFNISELDVPFPNTGILSVPRSAWVNHANERTMLDDDYYEYIHNMEMASVNGRSYLIVAETYSGIGVYDITGALGSDPKLVAFFNVNLHEDVGPALGAATDGDILQDDQSRYVWGSTVVPGRRQVYVWGMKNHYALEWDEPSDPAAQAIMLSSDQASLPRMKSPSMLYGMDEQTGTLRELLVTHVDRELDIAVLKFKDEFQVSSPLHLEVGDGVDDTLLVASYDGSHNEVPTMYRATVTKRARTEKLVEVFKTYKNTGVNAHSKTLLHDMEDADTSVAQNGGAKRNYIKRQVLNTHGIELGLSLQGGSSGSPVLNKDGSVVGMIQYQQGDSSSHLATAIGKASLAQALLLKRCPVMGITGSSRARGVMERAGLVSNGASSDMSVKAKHVASMEMAPAQHLTFAMAQVAGYYVESIADGLPPELMGAVITHVDGNRVGERVGRNLASIVCAAAAGDSLTVSYTVLIGENPDPRTATVTLKARESQTDMQYFYTRTQL